MILKNSFKTTKHYQLVHCVPAMQCFFFSDWIQDHFSFIIPLCHSQDRLVVKHSLAQIRVLREVRFEVLLSEIWK